ncbi:hypothetical protein JT358_15180 [Micrococcales bacterium 31B]|nr:hypothetical protein [Micrococcales bacterium 31B]
MHQRDILVEAFDPNNTHSQESLDAFDNQLTALFGTAFTSILSDPANNEQARRKWDSGDNVTAQRRSTQTEQRIVDVTLRDLLRLVRSMESTDKSGWPEFLNAVTLQSNWKYVVKEVKGNLDSHDKNSGYFWSSMLAATAGALEMIDKQSPTCELRAVDIESYLSRALTDFKHSRHPRARSGNTVKIVKEMADSHAVHVGAIEIAKAWNDSQLDRNHKILMLCVVGSALSPDLWHHPAAVRNLLIPAVTNLRNLTQGDKSSPDSNVFSLDSGHLKVELLIERHLSSGWKRNKAW